MRFRDFLRLSVLLFGGAATVLAFLSVVAILGADDRTLLLISFGWWVLAAAAGLWLGRRPETTHSIGGLLADSRRTNQLPELEPGTILFNRLWPLAAVTVAAGVAGIWIPQVPAIATGYAILMALLWRRQSAAVEAIEGRDGAEFWFDRSSPFGAPKLLRLPGLRKIEPVPDS
jgi:hypothetical protein